MIYDVIIIGGGTAGLSAAVYGARAGKSVLLLEATVCGGQIINSPNVENYPGIRGISGYDFAAALYGQAISAGAEIRFSAVSGIEDGAVKTVFTEKERFSAKAIILATGAKSRPLGLEREQELIGKGISYCATCDGAFFRGKAVAVVGGGNTALEDAITLSDLCAEVFIIHRRAEFRGEEKLLDILKEKPNVKILTDTVVTGLFGERLEKLSLKNVVTEETSELAVSGLFIAVGQVPQNSAFAPLIALDGQGYIIAGEDCRTNVGGIFAAGDCRVKKVRQLATAAADGATAALEAAEYVNSL